MRLIFIALIAGVIQVHAVAESQGYYSIIAPGTVHPDSKYNVAVSVHQMSEPCSVKLSLEGPDFKKQIEVDVQPTTVANTAFILPDIKPGDWKLTAEGLKGIIFTNTTQLNYADHKPTIYAQTDKATYKPGDLVQFRIIFLDEKTRPAKIDKPISVFIKDAANNRVKQFSNVTIPSGVFTGKIQLSEFTLLGLWAIEVQIDGASVYKKDFEVAKYVLPKFQVTIDAPKAISMKDEALGFTVRSKYTFGKLVKGKTTVTLESFRLKPGQFPTYETRSRIHPFNRYPGLPPPFYTQSVPLFRELFTIEKIIESNGKDYLEFKMKDIFPDGISSSRSVKIFVETAEELTGKKQNATTHVQVLPNRFHIEAPNMAMGCDSPEETFNFSATITDVLDQPVDDPKNNVTFQINVNYREPLETKTAYLNKSGIASISLKCREREFLSITVTYQDEKAEGSMYFRSTTEKTLHVPNLTVQTVKPSSQKIGENFEVEVLSPEPMTYFVYSIVGLGNIIKSEHVKVPGEGSKNVTINLKPTSAMANSFKIYVHYVKGENFRFYETELNVPNEFSNSISVFAPPQTVPGGEVDMKIRTDKNSFVGLMGVDQSVLLLKSGNDFNAEAMLSDVQNYKTETPQTYKDTEYRKDYPGGKSGVVTMTNAHYPYAKRKPFPITLMARGPVAFYSPPHIASYPAAGAIPGPVPAPVPVPPSSIPIVMPPPPEVRTRFLETWFFEDIESVNDEKVVLKKQLPDTITSWVVTGFSLNPESGFALTKVPTTIKTFKPFFLSTNLPYSIKRGEKVAIPVILFNYMEEPLSAQVTMSNEDDEFDFEESVTDKAKHSKTVTVDSNNGETITFTIRPKKIGYIHLKVTATSALAGDAIDKKLKVEPEGITIYKNRDYYVQADRNGLEVRNNVSLDIPKDIVPDSEHIEVSVVGDILGSTITNLDKLVRMPSGCGEQNMVNFVPNILVLRYLESINNLNPVTEAKAKHYLEVGYQRELTYRHDNGSYSAFGKSDNSGSTWLTAYVVRSFHQAKKYIDIDQNVLSKGLDFLSNVQAPNGSFPEIGKVLDFSHHNDVGLTAFVLIAFLENSENSQKYENTIQRGFKYLEENIKKTDDLYALSIAVYALQVHKSPIVDEILSKLDVQARLDGGLKWWTKSVVELRPDQAWRPKSHDVEVTGYILMTLLEKNELVLPITKWLLSQRNSNGGFSSTQETVVGLQALIKFAEKTSGAETNLKMNIKSDYDDLTPHEFTVNSENNLVMQTLEPNNQARQVNFTATGKGAAILQISYRYNIVAKEDKPSFKLDIKVKEKSNANKLSMDICTEFVPLEDTKESNMVVMEVALPSGYVADKEVFQQLREIDSVKRIETKNGDTSVVVYLDSLKSAEEKCMPIEAELVHDVTGQKPVPVVIYDYYDSQKRASEFYKISN